MAVDFLANAYLQKEGQRLEVIPGITQIPIPNDGPTGTIKVSVQLSDRYLGAAPMLTVPAGP
jgi:stage V sporulation protein SpoVS